MTNDIKETMNAMEQELREVGYEGYLLQYLDYVPDRVSSVEVQEAASEFADSMEYIIENLGVTDRRGGIEGAFMHGFFVALAHHAKVSES